MCFCKWIFTAILFSLLSRNSIASNIEFNTDILDVKDKSNIDLSRFSRAGYIMPGNYLLAVKVNNRDAIPEQSIDWHVPDGDPKGSEPCLSPELVSQFGLKSEIVSQLKWGTSGKCLDISSLKGVEARGDLGEATLYLNIPQAYLDYETPNWDPPSRWDEGISGLLFDYYVNGQTRHTTSGRNSGNSNLSGNGTTGINVGPWRIRADWQGKYDPSEGHNGKRWDWSRYYAYRALPSLGAKLQLGEGALYSDIFDSFSFTGASLISDDNMLPPNLRGYAPEVSGVAKTNAKVIISQQGRVIEETQVAAGPFRINDLNDMVSGELDVRVEEQDGSVQNFKVDTASVPYLTRPGTVRFKGAVGQPSDGDHHRDGEVFASGEFSWGVSNGWSLYGGGIGSKNYQALAVGIGRDLLAFGAISLDATQARSLVKTGDDPQKYSGGSYRLSYSKRFDSTDSQVTFAGYRFSDRNFLSMDEYLAARSSGQREGEGKEMYTVTLSQQLRELNLSAYLNYSHQTYWDRSPDDRYTLTIARYFDIGELRNLSLSATAYRNKYLGMHDDGVYLSLSIPWGNAGTVSYSSTLNSSNSTHQLSYYGRAGERDSYQVSAGTSDSGGAFSGYWNHEGDIAQVNTSASYQAGQYTSLNVSAQGGFTATAEGAALHRTTTQGGTRMLLDTDGVSDIPLKGFGANTMTNHYGKAVVADVNSYYRNKVSIDLDSLPDNADSMHSVVQATLTEGAIGYRKFDVISGEKAMAIIRLANGSYPPFGAAVQNAKQQAVGIVGDEGSVYLSGLHPGEKMTVLAGDDKTCEMTLPDPIPTDLNQKLLLLCEPLTGRDSRKKQTGK